jgi:hypothetical protein
VRCGIPIISEMLLMTDLVNLKIKSTPSFRGAHKDKICVRVFIGVSAHTCMSIYICIVFLKKVPDKLLMLQILIVDVIDFFNNV